LKKHTTQAKLQEKQERNNKKKRETGIVSCRSTCSVKGRKETKEKKRVRKITPFEPAALPQHSLLLLRKKKKKKTRTSSLRHASVDITTTKLQRTSIGQCACAF
jgi:hypothetical protein